MKTLSIKDVAEFRNKSERSKKTFVDKIKLYKEEDKAEGGGDYWVSCLSAISNSYKSNDVLQILDKKEELEYKHAMEKRKGTKIMYERNIGILYNYENVDFKKWIPKKLQFIKQTRHEKILSIKGLQIKATPHHVFTFQRNGIDEVGAIWFVAKLNGFEKEELGMFADILYRYLKTHYAKDYKINSNYCIAVDVFKTYDVTYAQLGKSEVASVLSSSLDEIKKML